MSTWHPYPTITAVEPLSLHRLLVTFNNAQQRLYDFSSQLDSAPFSALRDEVLFKSARVDAGGYGIVWNDDLDIAESELWLHGQTVGQTSSTVLAEH